jgi:membrane protease YdiL (CAAX protease family)
MALSANGKGELTAVVVTLPVAFALWYGTFVLSEGNFWLKISLSAAILGAISLWAMGAVRGQLLMVQRRHLGLGVASAVFLYAIFWLGKFVLTALYPAAPTEIASVYARREAMPPWLIAPLLILVTGPAEEIYWRGLLQRVLVQRIGPMTGLLLATACYALVHIWTLNTALVLAAFTAGLVWGWVYLVERSLVPVIISHALWSVTIFVLLPLN